MNEENNDHKPRATFALGIRTFKDASSIRTRVDTLNTGVAEGDILLIIETWLEQSKQDYKDRIKTGFLG